MKCFWVLLKPAGAPWAPSTWNHTSSVWAHFAMRSRGSYAPRSWCMRSRPQPTIVCRLAQFTGLVREVVDVHAVVGVRLHQHHGIGSPSRDADGAVDAVVGLFGDQHHIGVGLTNAVAPRVLSGAAPACAERPAGHRCPSSAVTAPPHPPATPALPHLIQEQMLQGRVGRSHLVDGLPVVEQVGQGAQHGFCGKGTATWWPVYLGSCNWLERSNTA